MSWSLTILLLGYPSASESGSTHLLSYFTRSFTTVTVTFKQTKRVVLDDETNQPLRVNLDVS